MKRKITARVLVAALVLLLSLTGAVLIGCSSNYGSSNTANNQGGGDGGTGGGGQTGGATASVTMQNISFHPSALTVAVGTTVTWTNEDSTSHDVTFTDLANVKSAVLSRGQTFSYTFTTPGTFHYYCTIHGASAMSGTVTVQ